MGRGKSDYFVVCVPLLTSSLFLQIGVWKSWAPQQLDIRDIVWPGNSHAPPQGVPEKFHLKITFLEEAPYINLSPADPVSGKCLMDRGILCRVAADHEMAELVFYISKIVVGFH